ncbi:MAG TPA: family 43 glycosylhydrolase, partial [Verrucomicrobiae bacterium]
IFYIFCNVRASRFYYQQVVFPLALAGLLISCGRKQTPPVMETVTIDNVEPRRDVSGRIIDAHDGCLQLFGGRFYLYGTAYGTNDGYHASNCYRVYSSPDLEHWTLEGDLLKQQPDGVCFRPYVVFNPNTRKYVLWFNWYPEPWNARGSHEGVAVSDSPVGPFTIVKTNVNILGPDSHPGDGSLFMDDDGTGYYIFDLINEGYAIRIARLTQDYLGLTGEVSEVLATGGEAPILFRRNQFYYALSGPLCAFCPEGSEVKYMRSTSPLGPYAFKPEWNINRRENTGSFISAQESWVAKIPASGEPELMWMADRWQSTPDKIKGHDFQYWSAPLEFATNGDILPIKIVPKWFITWGAEPSQ